MYPPPLVEEPTFNVSYTRQPVNTASGQRLLSKQLWFLTLTQAFEEGGFGGGLALFGIWAKQTMQPPPVRSGIFYFSNTIVQQKSGFETQG